jgi:hypothetical protein
MPVTHPLGYARTQSQIELEREEILLNICVVGYLIYGAREAYILSV